MISLGFGPTVHMGGQSGPLVTYIGAVTDIGNRITYDQADTQDVGIGAAAPDRLVVAVCYSDSGNSLTLASGTIGGNTASVVSTVGGPNNDAGGVGIMCLRVPEGTTADIFPTWSNTSAHCRIDVFTITGQISDTPITTGTSQATPASVSVTATLPAALIAGAHSGNSTTCTWTNATEKADEVVEAASTCTCAMENLTANYSSTAVTADFATESNPSMALAVWR